MLVYFQAQQQPPEYAPEPPLDSGATASSASANQGEYTSVCHAQVRPERQGLQGLQGLTLKAAGMGKGKDPAHSGPGLMA